MPVKELKSLDLARLSSLERSIVTFQESKCLWYENSVMLSFSVLHEDVKNIFDHRGFGQNSMRRGTAVQKEKVHALKLAEGSIASFLELLLLLLFFEFPLDILDSIIFQD